MSAQNEYSQVMERAPWQIFAVIFKKKKCGVGKERASILPPDFKIIFFKNFILRGIVVRKPDFAACTRAIYTNLHPWYNKYQNYVCVQQ